MEIIYASNDFIKNWKRRNVNIDNFNDDSDIIIYKIESKTSTLELILNELKNVYNYRLYMGDKFMYLTILIKEIKRIINNSNSSLQLLTGCIEYTRFNELSERLYSITQEEISKTYLGVNPMDIDEYLYHSDIDRINSFGSVVMVDTCHELNFMNNIVNLYQYVKNTCKEPNSVEVVNNILHIPVTIKIYDDKFIEVIRVLEDNGFKPYNILKYDNSIISLTIKDSICNYKRFIERKQDYPSNELIKNIIIQISQIFCIYHIVYK